MTEYINRHIKDKIFNLYLATVASFYLCFTESVMGSRGENEILVWFVREVNMDTGIPLALGRTRGKLTGLLLYEHLEPKDRTPGAGHSVLEEPRAPSGTCPMT